MKRICLFLIISILYIPSSFSDNYSLLYEEDYKSVMIIHYNEKEIYGEIIAFGGYHWMKKTFSNSTDFLSTFIQPSDIGIEGDMNSYTKQRYIIDNFEYSLRIENGNQILPFRSKEAFQNIVGYITRNETFSFASYNEETWYAGLFSPLKSKDDLINLAHNNQLTFCMLLNVIDKIEGNNLDLKTKNIRRVMSMNNYNCNNSYLLN